RRRELYQTWSDLLRLGRGQVDPVLVDQVLVQTFMRRLRQRLRPDRTVAVLLRRPRELLDVPVYAVDRPRRLLHMVSDRPVIRGQQLTVRPLRGRGDLGDP